jgi:molybdopterin-containing oxidoreductase family membrane subunit
MLRNVNLYIWLFFLIVLIEIGAYGLFQIHFKPIMSVEPFESDVGVPWRLLVATYVFFVVSTTGLCIVSSLGEVFNFKRLEPIVKMGLTMAVITIVVGLMTIALEIEKPVRGPYAFLAHTNPNSLMFWMISFYALYLVFLLIEYWFLLRSDLAEWAVSSTSTVKRFIGRALNLWFFVKTDEKTRKTNLEYAKAIGFITVVVAIIAHSNLGALFGVTYQPFWHGPFMPIYFILSAIISGAALIVLTVVPTWKVLGIKIEGEKYEAIQELRNILGFTLVVDLFFTSWKFASKYYFTSAPESREAIKEFLFGQLSFNFWTFEMAFGIILPIIMLAIPRIGRSIWGVFTASLFVIIGIFVLRYDLVIGGLLGKSISGVPYTFYSPHIFEIMAVVGFFGVTGLLYTLMVKLLPIVEVEEVYPAPTERTVVDLAEIAGGES